VTQQDEDRLVKITRIVTEVELVKQISLNENQKTALIKELYKMNLPIIQLQIQADIVKRSETYGKLSLEYWLKNLPVFSYTELKRFVDKEIERRRTIAVSSGINMEEIHKQGLSEIFFELQVKWYEALEHKKDDLRKECLEIFHAFKMLSEKDKKKFLSACHEKGLLIDDAHWKESMKFVIPQIYNEAKSILNGLKWQL